MISISLTIGFVNLFFHPNQVYFSIISIKILDIIRQGVLPKAFGKSAEPKYIYNYINAKISLRTSILIKKAAQKIHNVSDSARCSALANSLITYTLHEK